jgi:pilus assembly protein CpaE
MSSTEPQRAVSVAVVDDDPRLRTRLAMQLGDDVAVASFPSVEAMEEKLGGADRVVVMFGPSFAEPTGLKSVEAITRYHPEAAALLVVDELSTALLQQALRAGVRDVLSLPADSAELRDAVGRVLDTIPARPAVTGASEAPETRGERGNVITVFSAKGGTGKSVIASNLAVTLARRAQGPVAIVDADLKFGDIAVMLKLTPQHTILDAVNALHRLDVQLMQSLLVRHPASGLLVLPAPVEPAFADQVSASAMIEIIHMLQSFCEYVVVDTPADYNDVVLALLEGSDDILLITGMDIPSIKNVRVGIGYLRLLNIPTNKIKLVVNRANSRVRLDVGEVERTLQLRADCLVPSDIVVPQAVNKGAPAVLDAPRSAVAKSFEQLSALFLAGHRSRRDA